MFHCVTFTVQLSHIVWNSSWIWQSWKKELAVLHMAKSRPTYGKNAGKQGTWCRHSGAVIRRKWRAGDAEVLPASERPPRRTPTSASCTRCWSSCVNTAGTRSPAATCSWSRSPTAAGPTATSRTRTIGTNVVAWQCRVAVFRWRLRHWWVVVRFYLKNPNISIASGWPSTSTHIRTISDPWSGLFKFIHVTKAQRLKSVVKAKK